MDSWPYEISTLFTSASPDSVFASETRTSQSQTGSCQNCISPFTSAHSSLQLCTRSSHRELGCLGSIGEILLSVTVMKVLNNFFEHWLILDEMGAEHPKTWMLVLLYSWSLLQTCWVDDFKHLSLCAWSLFPLLHYFTASISVIAEYNEINLFYKTFLVWQLDINTETKTGHMEYANSGFVKSSVFGDLISENISEILEKIISESVPDL